MNAKQTAIAACLVRTAAIYAKLERLQQLADDHFGHDPDAIHWGHVGDLGRVERVGRTAGDFRRRRVTTPTNYRGST